ncbi:MAG TPA: hypothetical protein VGP72_06435 [Planctomycetota bacterium]
MPMDIVNEVQQVLAQSARGKGIEPSFVTAYQILERLPPAIRQRLKDERGRGGAGTGVYYSAPSVVAEAAAKVPGVIIGYLDTGGLKLVIGEEQVEAGNVLCGIYRVPRT